MIIVTKQAEKLAVAYDAYHQARRDDDWNGVACWGRILIEAQNETGADLLSITSLESSIARAHEMHIQNLLERETHGGPLSDNDRAQLRRYHRTTAA